jgi:hypothetical protein
MSRKIDEKHFIIRPGKWKGHARWVVQYDKLALDRGDGLARGGVVLVAGADEEPVNFAEILAS